MIGKIVAIAVAIIAVALIVWGYRATIEPGQSADVQLGGIIPIFLGVALLALDGLVVVVVWLLLRI